jgi:hypothetical protein
MTNSQRLSTVRAALRKWITDRHPAQDDSGKPTSEAMLIRDGYFCGRRFRFQLYHAVWFIEEDEVKIVSTADAVICRLNSRQIDSLAQAWNAEADETHTLSIAAHLETTADAAVPLASISQIAEPAEADQSQRAHRRAA